LNSAINAENTFVSISRGKNRPVRSPIPIISDIIIVQLAGMISSFAEIAANTRREEGVSPSRIISVKSIEKKGKTENPPSPPFNKGGMGGLWSSYGKGP
jgi:hypothetical protein